jgi:hypothetical protein
MGVQQQLHKWRPVAGVCLLVWVRLFQAARSTLLLGACCCEYQGSSGVCTPRPSGLFVYVFCQPFSCRGPNCNTLPQLGG